MKLLRASGVFLSTVALYLGLVLLGWGMLDLPGFFASPARLAYSLVVSLFGWLVAVQAYASLEGIQDSRGLEGTRIMRQTIVGTLLVGLLFAALILLPFTSRRGVWVFPEIMILGWSGVLLCALGYLLIYWSGRALGRMYSAEVVLQQDHQLVTSGPYSLVRHPRYLGILCLSLGLSLLFHTWLGLILCLPTLALVLWRIQDEEKLLQNAFGEAWLGYCQRSWRLLPYLY